jgi:hypothetical protein
LVELCLNGVHSQQRTPELDDVLIMRRGDQFALAKDLGEKAVAEYEGQLKEVTLSALTGDQLKAVDGLGATWDTLGWAAFRLGDLSTAEKYVNAAWMLLQHPTAADHLGQMRILHQTDHPFSSEADHSFSWETDQCSPVKAISVLR